MKLWLHSTLHQAAWAPIAVFIFYAIAAKGFNAYLLYPWLDMPTHFFGGLAMTYFFRVCAAHSQRVLGSIPLPVQSALSIGLTAIVTVMWEFLEYGSDMLFGTKMNLGVSDTLSDLFFGFFGGAVALILRPRLGAEYR